MSDLSNLEILQNTQINFENLVKMVPFVGNHPIYKLAKEQLDNALIGYEKDHVQLDGTMNIYTKPGERVIFTGENGFELSLARARNLLVVGCSYEIIRVDVGDFISTIELKGYSGEAFNTVMFRNE